MRRARVLSWVYVGAVLVFMFAPIIVMVLFAFNGTSSESSIRGFSLRWFRSIFHDPQFMAALTNSLEAALVTGAFVAVFGTIAALGLSRLPARPIALLSAFFSVPLILPGLFIGIALLAFFSKIAMQLSLTTVIAGHILITLPLVIAIVAARLDRLDRAIVEAARDLGAGSFLAFRRVLLPLLAPAIVGSVLLALAWSLDEFIITLFTNGGAETVPVYIFGHLRFGLTPAINAIAALMLAITVCVSALAGRFISVRDLT